LVSCLSSTFCALISFSRQGRRLQRIEVVRRNNGGPAGNPAWGSCVSPAFCALVGNLGNAFW